MSDAPAQRAQMLANRISKNVRRLRSWVRDNHITCYRIYDRDIPEIPLVIDRYAHWLHVAVREREEESSKVEWRELLAPSLTKLKIDPEAVFIKRRQRQRGDAQYDAKGHRENRRQVGEGGHLFYVNLRDYLDTGLFLDHRDTRKEVQESCKDKSFLNLFCYTHAFGVYAAKGDAATSLGIDLSATYLRWARDNLTLNGAEQNRHRLLRGGRDGRARCPC